MRLTGGPEGHATLSAPGCPGLPSAPPLEHDGPGDAWSPEHLRLASVDACFLFTCLVSASLAAPVRVEPQFVDAHDTKGDAP